MRILELVWAPNVNNGVRLAAIKFAQRVILVQTRGINDPRVGLYLQTRVQVFTATSAVSSKTRTTLTSTWFPQTILSCLPRCWRQRE